MPLHLFHYAFHLRGSKEAASMCCCCSWVFFSLHFYSFIITDVPCILLVLRTCKGRFRFALLGRVLYDEQTLCYSR